jgi:hypothetical protein
MLEEKMKKNVILGLLCLFTSFEGRARVQNAPARAGEPTVAITCPRGNQLSEAHIQELLKSGSIEVGGRKYRFNDKSLMGTPKASDIHPYISSAVAEQSNGKNITTCKYSFTRMENIYGEWIKIETPTTTISN